MNYIKALSEPGRLSKTVLMIDAWGWRVKRTTSVFLVQGSKGAAILETAHRSSADKILGELKRHEPDPSSIHYVFVTHRHADHAGGAAPLVNALPNAVACGHRYAVDAMRDPQRINEATVKAFGEYGELMDPIEDEDKLLVLKEGQIIDLGNGVELEVVHTPGHTSDHYSYYERSNRLMFCGDAAGILGTSAMSITPTTFPPSFKYKPYVSSLEKMLAYDSKIVAFAHFGAVVGEEANDILRKSLETTEDWKETAEEVEGGADALAEVLRQKYQHKLEVFPPRVKEMVFDMLAEGLSNALPKPKA